MRHLALAICAGLCLTAPAFAQDAPPPGGAAPAPAAADSGKAGGGTSAKEIRTACRDQAKGQGLKGQAMRQAMMDCVAKQNPGMAGAMKCRMEAKDKGLKAGSDEMRSYMRDCKKKSS